VAPTPTTPQPAAGTPDRPPATGAPAPTPASQPAQPAASQPGTKAPAASAAAGNDTCAKPGLPGSGKLCFDTVAGQRGPLLVVVPGIDGGKPYAMSRTEISVVDFNKYCSATKQCAATAVADRDFGNTPVSNISVAQAKAYAAWLGSGSGHAYRLPTDAEWAHAAAAGGRFRQADDSNCIPPSSDGTGAPVSARGRSHNPWGLVNMTGNVWEWVTSGGGVAVRGGSFTSYWSDCNVDTQRSDSGSPQKDVGFRVLREVK
jgi:non-specific serine/threonine protein kinase